MRVYVQGDWVAAPVSGMSDEMLNANLGNLLMLLREEGVVNTATWHLEATGVTTDKPVGAAAAGTGTPKSNDVLRNTRQIDDADAVVTYLQRDWPEKCHWGSLACIAYALGRGKPCYVLAADITDVM